MGIDLPIFTPVRIYRKNTLHDMFAHSSICTRSDVLLQRRQSWQSTWEHILEHRKTVISIRRYDCRGVDHWWFWRRNMYLEHSMQVSILIQIHQANDTPFNPIIKRWKCRYKYYLYRLLYALILQDHSSPIIFGFSTSRSYIWGLLIWKLKPRKLCGLESIPLKN